MTEQSSEDAARGEWVAGWIDGVVGAARGAVAPVVAEEAYADGYGAGGALQRRVAATAAAAAVAQAAAVLAARRASRRALRRTAGSLVVVAATWFALLVVDPLAPRRPEPIRASPAAIAADPSAPDDALFLALLAETSEPERLAILALLRERAERGALLEEGRPPLERVVIDSTSPDVALAAAGVVKILS